ncbi:MAG TPA: YceH family protein [Tepidisphaeraceae bacterium]|jgi:hypothetical protein|nr:YceH family protein [Tepidisphaeraceae bacterium]
MLELTPHESRILGVLIEKAFTTPNQYPLSLNALATGAGQLSNRDPVMQMTEDQAFDAVESLRQKQLAVRVDQVGSRVHKYKHLAAETLRCSQPQLAILAELLLRGPQTLGELRSRASRMQPLESLDRVTEILRGLMEIEEPLVQLLPPAPGSRAEQYTQLLSPIAHPIEPREIPASPAPAPSDGLSTRVTALEAEVKTLHQAIQTISQALGIPDPTQKDL